MDVIDQKKITYFEDTQYPLPARKKTKQTKRIIWELSYQEYNQIAIIYFV